MKTFTGIGIDQMREVAEYLISLNDPPKLWAFHGEMGAGKTTLIKEIVRLFGVKEEVSSPTFSLVNEYHSAEGKTIYHFDFYRIKSIEEAYDIGYEDYIYSGNLCLIEWPEKVAELLEGEDVINIRISLSDEHSRTLSIV